jgi:putative phage-type endonuclease
MFTRIDLDQGSAEWLRWRHGGIGASDAPALMGENPWKSAARLLKEKTAPPPAGHGRAPVNAPGRGIPSTIGSSAMARGNALEPHARALYCEHAGVSAEPVCIQSNARPWQRASLDGLCSQSGRLVEIKCGDKVYALTAETGTVPRYYVGQLQHILAVTGYASIDFWVWLPGLEPLLLTVPRDDAYIARLNTAEAEFAARVGAAAG